MTEEGTLSIVKRGSAYQVRYAANNPRETDRRPRVCPDEGTLGALIHQLGTEPEAITQACAAARKGEVVVLRILLSPQQIQTFFRPTTERGM